MSKTDKLRHVLLAMYVYDDEAFEEELYEIATCIRENKVYDLNQSLRAKDLLQLLESLVETIDSTDVKERMMRAMVREVISNVSR